MMNAKFVRTDDGRYLVQVESETLFPRWGFALLDDELSYEGGFGVEATWTVVDGDEVPPDIRRELELVVEEIEEIEAEIEAEREEDEED
jgi:hypothetical protein